MNNWSVVLSLPAYAISLMLIWAFRKYVFTIKGTVTQHLGAAMFWFSVQALGRDIWWDVFKGFDMGLVSNWWWRFLATFAAFHALKALHLLIPLEDRHKWSVFTAWAYPYRLWRRLADDQIE